MEKTRPMKLLLRELELLVTTVMRVVVVWSFIVSSVTKSFAVDMRRLVKKKFYEVNVSCDIDANNDTLCLSLLHIDIGIPT